MAIQIHVDVAARLDASSPIDRRGIGSLVRRAARAALSAQGVDAAELSVTVLDDAAISEMNGRYLHHEGPTDVISFALDAAEGVTVGDIYIGGEQALRQAAALGIAPPEEFARLAIHGVLHVLGHDHPAGAEREQSEMWRRQEAIVREVVAA